VAGQAEQILVRGFALHIKLAVVRSFSKISRWATTPGKL